MLKVGDNIPDFDVEAFQDGEIKKFNLSEFKGKWLVLAFYPADFTFVCPTELFDLADLYPKFQEIGAEIMSISTDTVFVHKAWFENSPSIRKIKYPMVADPSAKLCKSFGTYIPEEGVSIRATFIVDPDGKIVAFEMHDNSIGRNAKEILRKLQASKYVREHGGEVCPARWEPGMETLKPSLDLVGKI